MKQKQNLPWQIPLDFSHQNTTIIFVRPSGNNLRNSFLFIVKLLSNEPQYNGIIHLKNAYFQVNYPNIVLHCERL